MKVKDAFKMGEYCLKKDLFGRWDFYRNYGADGNIKRCTYENFESVIVSDGLVKVYKDLSVDRLSVGLYNSKAELVLPVEWGDIFIFTSDYTHKPAYLFLKDYVGNWGVANIDGSIIMPPLDFATAMWKKDDQKEYLTLFDRYGKRFEYVVSDTGLVKTS